jgi:hypothetical protein
LVWTVVGGKERIDKNKIHGIIVKDYIDFEKRSTDIIRWLKYKLGRLENEYMGRYERNNVMQHRHFKM